VLLENAWLDTMVHEAWRESSMLFVETYIMIQQRILNRDDMSSAKKGEEGGGGGGLLGAENQVRKHPLQ